ncbi:MAG TPA: alpha-L-fucosidase [Opitutaceae bacterium]|nr:alpha-L-fucosidase [Opitutaceae bacterium]
MNAKPLAGLLLFVAACLSGAEPASMAPAIRMAPAAAGLPPLPAVVRDESPAQTEARLAWFREARFGMFIHWGVYAVPAGTWNGRHGAEWIMNQAKIPVAAYRALAKDFTAAKYDPQAWAQLAEDAGVRYVVITAKHHDGFALFDSAYSDWNAVKASGARRDLIQPLADAVRGHGMKFGTYYSQSQDWNNLGGGKGNTPPWDDEQKQGSFDEYLQKIALPQVRELVDKFHPDILWWDTEYSMTPERARPFFDLVVAHPNILHNSRLGGGVLGDFRTSEQRIPASAMLGRALEVNMTINNSWGYRADDVNWKSAQQLIRNLSDVASKDGNYLLNIGPTAEGVIPEPEVERLRAIGRWMKVNGEAIYGTRGAIYAQPLPWGRTTQKIHPGDGATLYLHVWDWPADGKILVPEVQQSPCSGRLLATGAAVTASVTPQGIVVTLPGAAPDPDVSVVALEFAQPVTVLNAAPLPTDTGASGTLADPSKSPPAK